MSIRHLVMQTVTASALAPKLTSTTTSGPDWDNPTSNWLARLEHLTGREVTADEQTQVADWLLYLPAEADVAAPTRVTSTGRRSRLSGHPTGPPPRGLPRTWRSTCATSPAKEPSHAATSTTTSALGCASAAALTAAAPPLPGRCRAASAVPRPARHPACDREAYCRRCRKQSASNVWRCQWVVASLPH
jgi:hypothetical protein